MEVAAGDFDRLEDVVALDPLGAPVVTGVFPTSIDFGQPAPLAGRLPGLLGEAVALIPLERRFRRTALAGSPDLRLQAWTRVLASDADAANAFLSPKVKRFPPM